MKNLIMAVIFATVSSGAFACRGGGYSPDLAVGQLTSDQIAQQLARLDKAYAIASAIDVVIGQTVSLVPYGGAAYNSGKTLGYTVMGDVPSATKAAISGAVGVMGQVPGVYGTISKAVDFAIDASQAVEVGQQVGGAFGR